MMSIFSNFDDYEDARRCGDNAAVVEHGTRVADSVTTMLGLIVGSRNVVSTRAITTYTLSIIDMAKYACNLANPTLNNSQTRQIGRLTRMAPPAAPLTWPSRQLPWKQA